MKHHAIAAATLLAVLLGAPVLQAHPGHEHAPDLRVWRDVDGLFELEASVVLSRDELVQLRKHDGSLVWIPVAKLSSADRIWVRDRLESIRQLNGAGTTPDHLPSETEVGRAREAGPVMGVVAILGLAFVSAMGRSVRRRLAPLAALGTVFAISSLALLEAAQEQKDATPVIQKHFAPFKHRLTFRWDEAYLYVGSNGLPEHPMMGGIRAWNQQVPLPQAYTGANAFRIPLQPRFAARPVSGKESLFLGAIAVAVNGVPIFNPVKQDGRTDTYLAGELDEFGGHCGRADDYHYHIGPVHLEAIVKGQPIAYALDGFPLYGYLGPDGTEPKNLDAFNGRTESDGSYRYYSTKTYPYVNGGLKGAVEIANGEVAVQPRAGPVRPFLRGLKGEVKIQPVAIKDDTTSVSLKYEHQGQSRAINYSINPNGTYTFTFVDDKGKGQTETYSRRERKGGKKEEKDPPKNEERKKEEKGPPKKDESKKKDDKRGCKPWLAVHFDELDADKDGFVSAEELAAQVERVFTAFDKNGDVRLTKDEYDVPRLDVKTPMAGFVRGHAEEIDADRDGIITRAELRAHMTRLFEKADRKRAGKITRDDAAGRP